MVKLDKLSLKELMQLKERVETELPKRKNEAITEARAEMDKVASRYGLATVEILSPSGRTRRTGGRPKWRDPKTGATWTGQGRPPKWRDRAVAI